MDKCCGKCVWHKYDRESMEFVCTNPESDNYGIETDYRDNCEEQEDKT